MSQILVNKLSAVRRKRSLVTIVTGVAAALGAVVLLVGVTMMLDWWRELSRTARAAMLAIELAIVAYVLIWHVVRPIVYGPDDEDLALAVEAQTPGLGSRLISVVQFLRPQALAGGVSASMVGALVRETEQMAEPVDFTRVVKLDRMTTFCVVAAVIVIGFFTSVAMTAPESFALLKRAGLMNVPVPRKTQVEVLSKDIVVPRGESVTITARASGLIIPPGGSVSINYPSGVAQQFALDRDTDANDRYSRTIDNVQESFQYVVQLNDGKSQPFNVTAAVRPAVSSIDCQEQFPAYTGAGVVKRQSGDLRILEGSRLILNVTANKPLKITQPGDRVRNYIQLHGVDQQQPLTVRSGGNTAAADGIVLPKGTTGFSVHLVDQQGLTSKNPAIYPITLIPDAAPRVSITAPKRNDELVTAAATVGVGFDASDDYGVSQVLLRWRSIDPDGVAPGAEGDGLAGTYFNNAKFEQPVLERVDTDINFDWGKSVQLKDNRKEGNLSIRWVGQLQPAAAGEYTFSVDVGQADARVFLDDRLVLTANRKTTDSQPIKLNAHQRYDLKVEYTAPQRIAPIRLYWQSPTVPKQPIPRSVLFSTPIADKTSLISSGGVVEKIIQLQIPTNKAVRGYYPWKISEISRNLPLGSVIQWRLEVRDNNNVSGPGVTFSEQRQLRLVSEADKRKELMDRMGDTLQQIDSIGQDQRGLTDRTAQIVTGKPIDKPVELPKE